MTTKVTFESIEKAVQIIRPSVIRTPLINSPNLSRMFDAQIYLKLENLQQTGSFKIRGAAYKIIMQKEHIGERGVVAASAGNHAQGVALAAKQANIPCTIVMPEWASISKQEATRAYGGEIILFGQTIGESLQKAKELAEDNRTFIHPFDDPEIIIGQGTIGIEIFEDIKDADFIFVPIGGGGLISGVATASKTIRPQTSVIGVQSALCPSASESLKRGKITSIQGGVSLADGISVKQVGNHSFDIIRQFVNRVVLVEEEQIAAAMLLLLERKKILAEGAGASPLAALLSGLVQVPSGSKVVLVVSGGNIDSPLLGRVINKGLVNHGRIARLKVWLSDTPGSLARLLSIVAESKANVLHIFHDRNMRDLPLYTTCVELELETRGFPHINDVFDKLRQAGYEIEPV